MQNLLLISQQDMLLSKCSGLGYAPVLRGGLSTVKGIWLLYPKHELRQRSINYTGGKKRWLGYWWYAHAPVLQRQWVLSCDFLLV